MDISKRTFLLVLFFSFVNFSSLFAAKQPVRVFIMHDPSSYTDISKAFEGYPMDEYETDKQFYMFIRDIINNRKGFIMSNKKVAPEEVDFDFVIGRVSKDKYDADLLLGGFDHLDDPQMKEEQVYLFSPQTLKSAFVGNLGVSRVKQLLDSTLNKDMLKDKINRMLDCAQDLLTVKADKIIDSKLSIVRYELLANSNDKVWIDMDFTDGEEEDPQNVALSLENPKANGEYEYSITTTDNHQLKIRSWFKNREVSQVHIDVDYDPLKEKTAEKTFSVVSSGGYVINFKFEWGSNGEIKVVKIRAKEHPYLPRFLYLK